MFAYSQMLTSLNDQMISDTNVYLQTSLEEADFTGTLTTFKSLWYNYSNSRVASEVKQLFLIITLLHSYFHAATLSNSRLKMLTCSIVSTKWQRMRLSDWSSSICVCVFFPSRSLALGFTMLLLEREGSHSCCFYTAFLSSGRSKRKLRWGWALRLCLFSCSEYVPSVTSLKFHLTVRNPLLQCFSFTVKYLQPVSWAAQNKSTLASQPARSPHSQTWLAIGGMGWKRVQSIQDLFLLIWYEKWCWVLLLDWGQRACQEL